MSPRPSVLVVEDIPTLAETFRAFLEPAGMTVTVALTGGEARARLETLLPDVLVLDLHLPDMTGIDLMRWVRERGLPCETVIITARGSVQAAVDSMREGAFDFIVKPFSADRLRITVKNALERKRLAGTLAALQEVNGDGAFAGMVGRSAAMEPVYRILQNVAPSSATVFIRGESGTGKELCAEALHRLSGRADGPFIAINCAAIPRDLLESEVFGHVKGAFTGASADRKGAALSAHGGTLFLDEVCEMDLGLQAKMLRFLQTRTVQRVGEDKARPCDARIVCASNRDPDAEVRAGRLREDLFYRLNVVALALPPLRDRDDDVLLIARHVLATVSAEEGRLFSGFAPEAERALLSYGWPGNVRELQNVIRSVVVLNTGPQVTRDMLPPEIQAAEPSGAGLLPGLPQRDMAEGIRPLDDVIRSAVEAAVVACGGNIPRAASALGVAPSTIYRRLQGWRDEDRG